MSVTETLRQIEFLATNAAEQARQESYNAMLAYLRHQHPDLAGPELVEAIRRVAVICGTVWRPTGWAR